MSKSSSTTAQEAVRIATEKLEHAYQTRTMLPPKSFLSWLESQQLGLPACLVATNKGGISRRAVLQLIVRTASEDGRVLVVSDRPATEMATHLIAVEAGIPAARLQAGHIHRNEWAALAVAAAKVGEANLCFLHTEDLSGETATPHLPALSFCVDIDDKKAVLSAAYILRGWSPVIVVGHQMPSATAELRLNHDPTSSEEPTFRVEVSGEDCVFPGWKSLTHEVELSWSLAGLASDEAEAYLEYRLEEEERRSMAKPSSDNDDGR